MSSLFTVLIAEKHYIDAIRLENKLFFEPFLDNKELAFCCWNPSGQSLSDSVPELIDTIGRKKEWRAVVINGCTDELSRQKNPFDVVDISVIDKIPVPSLNLESEIDPEEWEQEWEKYYSDLISVKETIYKTALCHPLQKLTTWLSFKPEDYVLMDVSEKNDIHEWALNEISEVKFKSSDILEKLERDQYRKEIKLKEMLRREFTEGYSFNIAYPKEIYCISPRTSEIGFFNPETYWNIRSKNEYSEFCDRNMYFDRMRFLVFDLLPETHKDYRCERIKFLSTVLIFATNQVPISTMEARRLYVLECKNDDDPLFTLVSSYDKKLAATYEVLENEIEHIYSEIPEDLTDKAAERLFCSRRQIEVSLDENCDIDALSAQQEIPLLPSYPPADCDAWDKEIDKIKKNYEYIVRHQRRNIKKGVDRLNVSCEFSGSEVSRLTTFQLDDIRDYTENAEDEMVANMPADATQPSKHMNLISEKSVEVKNIMEKRLSRLKAFIAGGIILLLTAILCVPFVMENISASDYSSVRLVGIFILILLASLLITLIILRFPLKIAINDFNKTMDNIKSDIEGNMKNHSKYFSITADARKGYKVLEYTRNNLDEYTKGIRIRKKHQDDIRKKRAELDEYYRDFIGGTKYYEQTMIQPYDYDFDKKVEYEYAPPYLAGFCKNIEFMESGNLVEVPSGYITGITVRMEEVYDK